MTENKRFKLIYNEYQTSNGKTIKAEPYFIDTKEEYVDEVYFTIKGYPTMSDEQVVDLLNEQEETIRKQNQEISACYDTLTTILEYVDAILNGLDIQDLFIKDYFQIIKNCDFNRMNKIIMELNGSGDVE